MRLACLCSALAIAFAACLPPAADGEGSDEEREDAGPVPPPGAAAGAFCAGDDECASGACTDIFTSAGLHEYCTRTCSDDSDCFFAEQAASERSRCVDVGERALCLRTCAVASGPCGEGICLQGLLDNDGLCGFFDGRCDGELDCADDAGCVQFGYEVDIVGACVPDDFTTGLRAGEACNDEALHVFDYCHEDADCPGGSCTARPAILNPADQCIVPAERLCANIDMCQEDGVCSTPCKADDDCPAGRRCFGDVTVLFHSLEDSSDNELVFVGACYPWEGSSASCARDGDCPAGEVCGFRRSLDGSTPVQSCRRVLDGERPHGALCADDPFTFERERVARIGCASAACVDGHCAASCVDDGDCAADEQCADIEGFGICVHGSSCAIDADCGGDERCVGDPLFVPPLYRCVAAWGLLPTGSACEHNPLPTPCADDDDCAGVGACDQRAFRCMPPEQRRCRGDCGAGVCTSVCNVDADCGVDMACAGLPFGQLPDGLRSTAEPIGRCISAAGSRAACALDADCAEGERCQPFAERDGTVRGACLLPPPDAVPDFDFCQTSGGSAQRCASGICDIFSGDLGLCVPMCTVDADCPDERPCSSIALAEIFTGFPFFDEEGVPVAVPAVSIGACDSFR